MSATISGTALSGTIAIPSGGGDRLPAVTFTNTLQDVSITSPDANKTFRGMSYVKTLTLPDATAIGDSACSGWGSLLTIDAPNVVSVGKWSFRDSALGSFNMPNLENVGEWAFSGCMNIGSAGTLSLPKVKRIEEYGFYTCGLSEVELGAIEYIGSAAFAGNWTMTTLTITRDDGVAVLADASAINYSVEHIYVPAALVDAYKAAENWSSLASKISAIGA